MRSVSSQRRRISLDIDAFSNVELAWIGGVVTLVLAGSLWLFMGWLAPSPQASLTIAAGPSSGAYYQYALKYREQLAQHGVRAEVIETRGTVNNLECLSNPLTGCSADIAFVQAGPWASSTQGLQSLAAVAVEPVWVFVDPLRAAPRHLADLRGRSIALGAQGSGTLPVALALLKATAIEPNDVDVRNLGGSAALAALKSGEIAAAFMVASANAPIVEQAIAMGMRPLAFDNALAYVRRLPWAQEVTLPRGALSLANEVPALDLPMLAVNTNLVSRSELHDSLKFLLLDIASRVHAEPGPAHSARQYPSAEGLIFVQGESSKEFFLGNRPWLYNVLPFWSARQAYRLLLSLLPVLVIVVPLMRALIAFGERRNRAAIMRLLARTKELQFRLDDTHALDERDRQMLRWIEQQLQTFKPLTIHAADYFRIHESLPALRAAARRGPAADAAHLSIVRAAGAAPTQAGSRITP